MLLMDPEGYLFQEEGGIARPEACTQVSKETDFGAKETDLEVQGKVHRERARGRESLSPTGEGERARANTEHPSNKDPL